MKESYYFPHDYDAAIDPKIQALIGKFGGAGYGIFWRVIEMLHSNSEHKLPLKPYIYSAIAKQMLTSDEQMLEVVMYCIEFCELFQSDGNFFWSDRVNKNFVKRNEISEKRSIAGRKGFEAKYKNQAIAQQILANGSKGKERKGKEKKKGSPTRNSKTYSAEFDLFYNAYPRREGKSSAFKVWSNMNGTRPPIEFLITKIEEMKKTEQWLKDGGKFIPYPEKWLSQKRWEDEGVILEAKSTW